jgi:alternative ribosome-rescue factor
VGASLLAKASEHSYTTGTGQTPDIGRLFPPQNHSLEKIPMRKKPSKHGPNKAKSIVAQPLFRSRQERPTKGKGSYRREAFQSDSWEASYFLAA